MKKKISIVDVAKKAEVSPGTVSNFLNNTAPVNVKTKEKITNAINELGYKRNVLASSLRRDRTNTIGVILPDIRNAFYSELYFTLEMQALKKDFNTILGNFDYSKRRLNKYFDLFHSRKVDAIIISANYTFKVQNLIDQSEVPVIIIEPESSNKSYSTVGIDNIEGSSMAVQHLIDKGHKDIAILTPSTKSERYMGYEKALENNNIDINKKLVRTFGKFSTDLFEQGYQAMDDLLLSGEKFSACFIITDMLAIGAMSAIKNRGLSVPEDIAVSGFDNIPLSGLVAPKLTTVSQPVHEIAENAFRICLNKIENKQNNSSENIILHPEIMLRETT